MRKAIVLSLAAIAISSAIWGYSNFTQIHAEQEQFNSHKWQNLHENSKQNDPGCVRGGMALTLVKGNLLKDKSASEVINQLGKPDEISSTRIKYPIGQCHWDSKHSDLIIDFNNSGIVSSITIEIH